MAKKNDLPTGTTGFQITGFPNGGSANKGQDVYFSLHVSDGSKKFDLRFFVQHDLLPALLSHLITYGGMARNTRIKQNPYEEADGTYASSHALKLASSLPGRSITAPEFGMLTLQFDAAQGRKLNLYCAAQEDALKQLRAACDDALALLRTDSPEHSRH